jgi:peptide deformylase
MEIVRLGDPRLHEISKPVAEDDLRTREVQDLIRTMNEMVGAEEYGYIVGLAANQVAYPLRIIVVSNYLYEKTTIVNPEFSDIATTGSTIKEGCLSLPGIQCFVTRPRYLRVQGLTSQGEPFSQFMSGFEAGVTGHEVDHLNGITILQRKVSNPFELATAIR